MLSAMIETGGGGVETDKNSRLLYLYEALICGEGLQKKEYTDIVGYGIAFYKKSCLIVALP